LQDGSALLASVMRGINNTSVCEGLAGCGGTGVSTTLNTVRERSAVKVARSVWSEGKVARPYLSL